MRHKKILFIIFLCCFLQTAFAKTPLTLSLHDAILLAVRNNPNVQSQQLSYLVERFNLFVQQWEFSPHYSLQASATAGRASVPNEPFTTTHGLNVQPGVSLLTPIGTQISLSGSNQETSHYNPGLSLQIMQPLMRGFGSAVVEAALNNAKDTECISRLEIEGVLRNTITSVIGAYLDVVNAERTVVIDQSALERAEKSVQQTKIYIKAGHLAGNELVTVQANEASAKSQLVNDQNNLVQTRYALLAAIGLDPNLEVKFTTLDIDKLIKLYRLPSEEQAKALILNNDIQYQVDQITLHGSTARNLLVAEDNTRWQLNLTANAETGNGSGGGQSAGVNSLFNGVNQGQSIGLTLQVPIDDQLSKQALFSAKIALKQAELALLQEKWTKQTSAINGWHLVGSAKNSLKFALDAEKYQEKTYNVSYQKYMHGLIDSLELQTAQLQLIQSQQQLLSSEISYVKSLVNMDLLTGHTLRTWGLKVRL